MALNNLGELLARSSNSRQARDHHTRALAIAREIGVPLEEARDPGNLRGGRPLAIR
jgi:hypothetical protein